MMKHCPESKNYSPVPILCQEPRESLCVEVLLVKDAETSRDAVAKFNLTSVVGDVQWVISIGLGVGCRSDDVYGI